MASYLIEITFQPGSIGYNPAVLWVTAGDEIQWVSNYNLRVTFQRGSPVGRIRIETNAGVPSSPEKVLTTAEKRGYHYHSSGAKLDDRGKLLFFSDPGCPEIIVE